MKSFRYISPFILSAVLLSACTDDAYKEALDNGVASLGQKDYHQAALYFEIALKENSKDADAKSYLAQATQMEKALNALNKADYEQAFTALTEVINDANNLQSIQEEAKQYVQEITDQQQIITEFDQKMTLIQDLLAKNSYDEGLAKLEEAQADIAKHELLAAKQAEVVKLIEQTKDALTNVTDSTTVTEQKKKPEQTVDAVKFKVYQNGRFGFTIQYPEYFSLDTPPDNGDGQVFRYGDVTLTAYGSNTNIVRDNETVEMYFDEKLRSIPVEVSYQKVNGNTYTVSYIENGMITYEKFFLGPSVSSTFIITYPESIRTPYDDVTSHIANTFVSGAQ